MDRPLYQTATRRKITEFLQKEHRYLTAAGIFAALKCSMPTLAKSTVYRTLELLEEAGVVMSRTDLDGEASFVACHTAHHHHAICRSCGCVVDITCVAIEALNKQLLAEQGFEVDGHEIELFGRCGACRKKATHARSPKRTPIR